MAPRPMVPDIIAYRDDAPTTGPMRRAIRQSSANLLDLADARILELAIRLALGAVQDDHGEVDDETLLRFLQSSEHISQAREQTDRFAGDFRTLDRLLGFRRALDPGTSYRAELPQSASRMQRQALGTVEWQLLGDSLEFRALSQNDIMMNFSEVAFSRAPVMRIDASPAPTSEDIHELEEQLRFLIEELGRYRASLAHSATLSGKALATLNSRIRELRDALLDFPSRREASSRLSRPVLREDVPPFFRKLDAVPEEGAFADAIELQSGTMRLHLSGSDDQVPTLRLVVCDSKGTPSSTTLVTIVEEGRGFRSVETNTEGVALLELGAWLAPNVIVGTRATAEFVLNRRPAEK